MNKNEITEVIRSFPSKTIYELAHDICARILEETEKKGQLTVIQELLDEKVLFRAEDYIIIRFYHFSVLIFQCNVSNYSANLDHHSNCFHLPLTDQNFKMIIKEIITNIFLCSYESASTDLTVYQTIRENVLQAIMT